MSNGLQHHELQDADLLLCAICSNTMQDAVLLQCLHSTCRSCVCSETALVACPVCGVVTDSSSTQANLLVAVLAHRSQVMSSVHSCTLCAAENQHDASSVTWCYTCQQSLCVVCEKYHKRYNSNHKVRLLDEHTVLSDLYRPPSRLCTKHGEELKLACFTCQDGRCFRCSHDCYTASHDVQLIDSPAAADRFKDKIMDADRIISEVNSMQLLLQAHLTLPEKVASAMQESRAVLRNAKKKVIDSISKAFDKAEQSLIECWEILTSKAQLLRDSADRFQKRLDWANKYCHAVLHIEDMTALLPQLGTLNSCLCTLLHEAKQLKQPADPLKLVSMNLCLPHDLDLVTCEWIGQASLVSDNFSCAVDGISTELKSDYLARRVAVLSELERLLKEQKEQQDNLEHDRLLLQQQELQLKLQEQQLAALTTPLSFDDKPCATLKGPGCCWDVAVTPHGRLLVAAMADGLKEYDANLLLEVATWKPDGDLLCQEKSFWVTTVDSLSDGRALVGLHPMLIVLLRRDISSDGGCSADETWQLEQLVSDLQAPPRHLSACGDQLLAVLEDRFDVGTNQWLPGPGLVLLSLCDFGKQLHRRQLDYNACSVALTDRCVVVASDDVVELTNAAGSDGGNEKCFVVDCYSHVGIKLWRHVVGGGFKVMSVCTDSVGRVLYAAKRGSVVTFGIDDGRQLNIAVSLATNEIESPLAVALDKAARCRLALISLDGDTGNQITIFSDREENEEKKYDDDRHENEHDEQHDNEPEDDEDSEEDVMYRPLL